MTVKLVRDLMHIGVTTCPASTPLGDAVRLLLCNGLESLIALDKNGHAVGLFGRREAVAAYGLSGFRHWTIDTRTVADVMQPEIPEVLPDIPATAAAQIMLDRNIRDLYLLHYDGGIRWPSAVLRFEDILHYLATCTEVAELEIG